LNEIYLSLLIETRHYFLSIKNSDKFL